MEKLQGLANLTMEDIKFLKDLARELKTQDNCATATPLVFKIRDTKIVTGLDMDYCDDICVVDSEGNLYTEQSELVEYIVENFGEEDDDNISTIAEREGFEGDLDCDDFDSLVDLLKELGDDSWTVTGYSKEYEYKGEFLTRESAKAHLEANYYHYSKDAVIYVCHGFRNPVLENLLEIVKKFD